MNTTKFVKELSIIKDTEDINLYCSDLQRTYQTLYLALKKLSRVSDITRVSDIDSSNIDSSGIKIVDVDGRETIKYNNEKKEIIILPCNHEVGDMSQCEGEGRQRFNILNENKTSLGSNKEKWGELILKGNSEVLVPPALNFCNFTPYEKFYNSQSRNHNLNKFQTRVHCTRKKFPENINYVQQMPAPVQPVKRGGKNVYIYPIDYNK